jgi:hypothetical protein
MPSSRPPHYFTVLLTFIIEAVLLLVICMIMLVGLLGVFLPILPGVLLIGIGLGMYTLMLRDRRSHLTRRTHAALVRLHDFLAPAFRWIPRSWIDGLSSAPRRTNRATRAIAHYSAALAGLDLAVVFGLLFGWIFVIAITPVVPMASFWSVFAPILLLLIFAEVSIVVWFRFGRMLGHQLRGRLVGDSALIVVASALPWLVIIVIGNLITQATGVLSGSAAFVIGTITILATVFAAAFKLSVVLIGALTTPR